MYLSGRAWLRRGQSSRLASIKVRPEGCAAAQVAAATEPLSCQQPALCFLPPQDIRMFFGRSFFLEMGAFVVFLKNQSAQDMHELSLRDGESESSLELKERGVINE